MRRIIALLFVSITISGFAQTKHLNLKKKLALSGYDPVSYFAGVPEEGKQEWLTTHLGARYQFVSEANRKKFLIDPDSFIPQYGGWCAYAMGTKGDKVKIDPKTFEIRDGKLFLYYNSLGTNTLKSWKDEGPDTLRKKADRNWSKTLKGR